MSKFITVTELKESASNLDLTDELVVTQNGMPVYIIRKLTNIERVLYKSEIDIESGRVKDSDDIKDCFEEWLKGN